jgi:hypothetical protein
VSQSAKVATEGRVNHSSDLGNDTDLIYLLPPKIPLSKALHLPPVFLEPHTRNLPHPIVPAMPSIPPTSSSKISMPHILHAIFLIPELLMAILRQLSPSDLRTCFRVSRSWVEVISLHLPPHHIPRLGV